MKSFNASSDRPLLRASPTPRQGQHCLAPGRAVKPGENLFPRYSSFSRVTWTFFGVKSPINPSSRSFKRHHDQEH